MPRPLDHATLAIKVTIPRLASSGSVRDTDIYGAQQHAPLLESEFPDQAPRR